MRRWLERIAAMVLVAAGCVGLSAYAAAQETVLTVGFLAGSYWDAPLGNCYAIIDAAIERFEEEHPSVRVEYTSGILKRDYSEWLDGE